jgi:hypothetical protein
VNEIKGNNDGNEGVRWTWDVGPGITCVDFGRSYNTCELAAAG